MAPSRRAVSNGRSPLVSKQSQITTFFSPGKTPKPSPPPSPNPTPSPRSSKIPSASTSNPKNKTTKKKKKRKTYSGEVVGRKIRVFWPTDRTWYEGEVRSFDKLTGRQHSIQFADAEEAALDLDKEKIEWIEEEVPRKLRRLTRMPTSPVKLESEPESDDDDEDWGKGVAEDAAALDDDSEEEHAVAKPSASRRGRGRSSSSVRSGKRKQVDVRKLDCSKKFKFDGEGEEPNGRLSQTNKNRSFFPMVGELNRPITHARRVSWGDARDKRTHSFGVCSTGDAAERFGKREAEKFGFLADGRVDAEGRRPGEAYYDPRTVLLTSKFLDSLPGGQRQWWEFKSKHMDKVLFFKMGKFYELFEMDAHIGVKELDLQYMKGEQPHCGFPEKNFSMNLEKLARKGYRVLVVEQTETPEQLERRRKESNSKAKVVKREICAVVTKGTLMEGESLLTDPDPSYLISITEKSSASENQNKGVVIGICVVDVSTSKFMVGQLDDDADRHCLCSILSELRPVEVIKPSDALSAVTEKVLKDYTRNPLVNSLVPSLEFWDAEKTIGEIRNIYRISTDSTSELSSDVNDGNCQDVETSSVVLPEVLSRLLKAGQNAYCALSALGGCLFYLRQALLDEALLKCAKFETLPSTGFTDTALKTYMILDAAALENLEILENRNGGSSGTLFAQLDHCVTSFGKRMLKCWLARPPYNRSLIVERQNAIAVFKGPGLASALEFHREVSRLPDVERLLARLFASCDTKGRNANRVVLYEDAARKQLQVFIAVLRGCQVMIQAYSSLSSILDSTESSLLHYLLTPGKGLSDVFSVLKHFEGAFDWTEAEHSGRVIPLEGGDTEYDAVCGKLKKIESLLKEYLKKQCRLLGDASITYVNVGKDSYLLEVPESLSSSVPREYELRSSRKGYFRYWTPEIKEYLSELTEAETDRESKLKDILQRLLRQFSQHHCKWRQLVTVIAELDVLISLSIANNYYEGPTCRPIIQDICQSACNTPYLCATSLGHPVLRSDALGKGTFVPNDVCIGGRAGDASFILLTGPNMGGKSTLIRQVCMAVILAQLGADVPAESFELTPVDRIFVRMGARDHIMAGQSTFLMELSETASMLSSATQNSLVALDELGRGTSTSDGQAIAGSVFDYLVHKVQCRGLFSTHYHRLALEYENDNKVSLFHMACQVGKGIGGMEEVTFLYKLTPGSCPKSYGVNVARLAGIPSSVLVKAAAKSTEFEISYGSCKNNSEHEASVMKDEVVAVMRELLGIVKTWRRHKKSQAVSLGLLAKIQQRARLLVRGN